MKSKENISGNWTEIISPKRNLLDINLREVWRYKDLLGLFVKRDMIAQYRQTILGPLWYIIQPVLTTCMFLIVFNKIANIKTEPLPAILFYMSSITIWNYFQSCFNGTSSTFVSNAGVFGKVYFPRLILPLATISSNLLKLTIQFALIILLIIYYHVTNQYQFRFGSHLLLLPVIIIIMAGMGLGLGIIISSLTTKYRDFTVLIGFGVQLLMYVTPVAYPLSYLEQSTYKVFIEWNPLSPMIEGFRYSIFGIGTFNTASFLYSLFFTIIVVSVGVVVFNKVERSFMDTV